MPSPSKFIKYSLIWPYSKDPLDLEFDMCREGGRWRMRNGEMAGEGMFYHFKQAMHILWPEIVFHDWADRQIKAYLEHRIIGQIGSASTGKTFIPSACVLLDYYMYPHCTTVLVSSTTRESLEMRVLGEVKKLHRLAKERHGWIPGNLIEGKQRIVTDDRSIAAEGRDFRNGLVGIAVKRGQNYQGIEEYVGIKNKRIRCLFDEAQFLPRVFVDSIANLNKNPDLKAVISGNPKDTTDALGIVCEPAGHLGGWDGGIDQTGGTKQWETRFSKGVCIQLVGTDSPNLDGKLGIPLITQEQIDADIKFYGEDSIQYSMMDLGRMPRGQGNRRVITRQMCLKFHAMEEPVWKDDQRIKIGFMDAAYSGTGGDRTVFGEIQFGAEAKASDEPPSMSAIVTQKITDRNDPQVLAVIDVMVVPVTSKNELPEDQIVMFVKDQCEQRKIPPENFFFDTTGRGSLMNAFGRLWSPQVQGIEFGGSPSDRKIAGDVDVVASDYYFNFMSELWFTTAYLIQAGQLRGMTEELMMEGCMREWGRPEGKSGKLTVEKKADMKKKSGRSPDLYDAFVCGVEGARRRGFVIKRQVAVAHKRIDHTWKKQLRERAQNLAKAGVLDHAA